MKRTSIVFFLILSLFLLTRLYQIHSNPPSLYWDEASIGYNAYSILKDGKDEWGEFMPLHFRAFGEFKLPVYIYATALSIQFFGLNEFAVRLPAVIFSVFIMALIFLIVKKITKNEEAALFAYFFAGISPWFFIFSRTGYEAVAGLAFYLLGIYLILCINLNRWILFFSILSFILSAYSYNSFRLLTPITLLILFLFNISRFKPNIKTFIIAASSLLIIFLSILPIYKLYKYDFGNLRYQAVAVDNSLDFIKNYVSHFSPEFLFNGDTNLRSQQFNVGQIYYLDALLVLAGIYLIIKSKLKNYLLLLVFLLISFIPSSITKEAPHALRSISAVPFIAIISSLGLMQINKIIKQRIYVYLTIVLVYLFFFTSYFINFINAYPNVSSKYWQYGYKQIFTKYEDQFKNFDKVIISDSEAQPYIFALFYLKYDPIHFRSGVLRNSADMWGFSTVSQFNNFIFTKVDMERLPKGKLLVFTSIDERFKDIINKDIIKNYDGSNAFYVYEIKKE